MLTSHCPKRVLSACLFVGAILAVGCDFKPANQAAGQSNSRNEDPSHLKLAKASSIGDLAKPINTLPISNTPIQAVADSSPGLVPTLEGPWQNQPAGVAANDLVSFGQAKLGKDNWSSDATPVARPLQVTPTVASKTPEDGFTEAKLHKNFTLFLLASEPDVRARKLMMYLREYLTPDQWDEGITLLMKYDSEFQALIVKRAEILNSATDGDDTEAELRKIKIETVKISDRLRILVYKEVLTQEQKVLRDKRSAEVRAQAKAEAESRAAKKVEQTQAR